MSENFLGYFKFVLSSLRIFNKFLTLCSFGKSKETISSNFPFNFLTIEFNVSISNSKCAFIGIKYPFSRTNGNDISDNKDKLATALEVTTSYCSRCFLANSSARICSASTSFNPSV